MSDQDLEDGEFSGPSRSQRRREALDVLKLAHALVAMSDAQLMHVPLDFLTGGVRYEREAAALPLPPEPEEPRNINVADVIEPEFRRRGVELSPARYLTAAEAKALPTTWARRLGHGRTHPRFVHFEGVRRD